MGMSSKGREGESGIADFINNWYPNADQGFGAKVIKSNGSKDIGDIDGIPYTCIEAKNWKDPSVGGLLNNAEWKAGNSKRPIWFLSYKRKGYSRNRAGHWHGLTTVEGFFNGFIPTFHEQPMALADVEGWCNSNHDFDNVTTGAAYPGMVKPQNQWSLYMMFRPFYSPIEAMREEALDDCEYEGIRTEHMRVPIVIHPRVGEPVEKWYVYTRLAGFVRMLENLGIVPQDESEYEEGIS